jgi:hypothetical protein
MQSCIIMMGLWLWDRKNHAAPSATPILWRIPNVQKKLFTWLRLRLQPLATQRTYCTVKMWSKFNEYCNSNKIRMMGSALNKCKIVAHRSCWRSGGVGWRPLDHTAPRRVGGLVVGGVGEVLQRDGADRDSPAHPAQPPARNCRYCPLYLSNAILIGTILFIEKRDSGSFMIFKTFLLEYQSN